MGRTHLSTGNPSLVLVHQLEDTCFPNKWFPIRVNVSGLDKIFLTQAKISMKLNIINKISNLEEKKSLLEEKILDLKNSGL